MKQCARARRRKSGQALVEYAFLLILMATVAIAVVIMAGSQLKGLFDDVEYEFQHLTDTTISGSPTCPDGSPAAIRGHQYKCN